MNDDTITPDRLCLAGWDDNGGGLFTRDGREMDFWVLCVAGSWMWLGRIVQPALLTGMADMTARLAEIDEVKS